MSVRSISSVFGDRTKPSLLTVTDGLPEQGYVLITSLRVPCSGS